MVTYFVYTVHSESIGMARSVYLYYFVCFLHLRTKDEYELKTQHFILHLDLHLDVLYNLQHSTFYSNTLVFLKVIKIVRN